MYISINTLTERSRKRGILMVDNFLEELLGCSTKSYQNTSFNHVFMIGVCMIYSYCYMYTILSYYEYYKTYFWHKWEWHKINTSGSSNAFTNALLCLPQGDMYSTLSFSALLDHKTATKKKQHKVVRRLWKKEYDTVISEFSAEFIMQLQCDQGHAHIHIYVRTNLWFLKIKILPYPRWC